MTMFCLAGVTLPRVGWKRNLVRVPRVPYHRLEEGRSHATAETQPPAEARFPSAPLSAEITPASASRAGPCSFVKVRLAARATGSCRTERSGPRSRSAPERSASGSAAPESPVSGSAPRFHGVGAGN